MSAEHVREYQGDGIVVEWRPALCFHSENCIRALPAVFDRDRRPWVEAGAAAADAVESAVALCPSGALRSRRLVPVEVELNAAVEITPQPNGPLLVRGPIKVLDADGNLVAQLEKAALCRCGQSGNKPFCDGTHNKVGFTG